MTPGSAAAWIEKQTVAPLASKARGLRSAGEAESDGSRENMAQKTPVGIETKYSDRRTLVKAPGW
jgi:hypothetical protein